MRATQIESLESRRYFSGSVVSQTALADLDGDGKPELIVGTVDGKVGELGFGEAAIEVLAKKEVRVGLKNSPPVVVLDTYRIIDVKNQNPIGLDTLRIQVAAGDLDGDGRVDVAALTWTIDTSTPDTQIVSQVTILHGDGKGGFDGKRTIVTPHVFDTKGGISAESIEAIAAARVVVGDVNGDGLADIVTGAGDEIAVAISEFGRGPRQTTSLDGSFSHGVGTGSQRLVGVADMDMDGRPDLVAVADGTIQYAPVEMSDGKTSPTLGTISKVDYAVITTTMRVAAGDVTGDGAPDIVVTDSSNRRIQLGKNLGKGGVFSFAPIRSQLPGNTDDVILGDLDGDGTLDILAVALKGSGKTGHVSLLKQ